jgi:hypothetical protein
MCDTIHVRFVFFLFLQLRSNFGSENSWECKHRSCEQPQFYFEFYLKHANLNFKTWHHGII